ncbi:ATP-binding protein [Natrarchaeobaculum aegyptiacum]|uniref:histidine kinase n=1 Tax=Natrarchaeobaculum aegyptiacum TaxID=745377 RepID=A0A2Z2HQI4_9EURY|nr:ATP-binding protein [Natrarchaeobaculum aegyptiacum]ARS89202.1 histidine kinase [Natrarchaeobaculum aegyptiacum]
MSPARGTVSGTTGRRTVATLGAAYIVFAGGWAYVRATGGEPSLNVLIVTALIVGPGVILIYGAHRLPAYDITPNYYPVIGQWCLGAIVVMTAILSLYHFQPADSFRNPHRSFLMFTALSSVAGLGVGIYDARARTRALEVDRRNRELRRMQALLEESNDRLEQFASAASHDLQEPLRMITRYLTLVEHRYADALDEDGREFVAFAIDGADRLQEMTDGLLEYSRVEADSDSFDRVDLDDVLTDALANLHVRIDESGAAVTWDSLPLVDGDRRQLRQVFQNLVSNAITYCGDEPPRIHVSAHRRGQDWVVSVRDWGIGIDSDDQDRIFDVFQRLHSREEHPGTGIGLALCKRIVEHHGGQIWVESDPEGGSTFSFSLPAVES